MVTAMAHVYVDATIKAKRSAKVRLLVDTGATHSLISPTLARKVGMRPSVVRDTVRLASGKPVRVPTAVGLIRVDGREAATLFWIGPCDEPLLGVETLEVLGLAVDPRSGRLRPTRPYASRLGGLRTR